MILDEKAAYIKKYILLICILFVILQTESTLNEVKFRSSKKFLQNFKGLESIQV